MITSMTIRSKVCTHCHVEKEPSDFHSDAQKSDGLSSQCKECRIAAVSAYQKIHPEQVNARNRRYRLNHLDADNTRHREYHQRIRQEAIMAYGGMCACCGESGWMFLAIDHVNGGGNQHRQEVGRGNPFFNWLKKQGYPEGFQVLCFNCNHAKGTGLVCPHAR